MSDTEISKLPIKKFKTTIGQKRPDWVQTPPDEANRSYSNLQNQMMDLIGEGELSVVESIEMRSQRSSSGSQNMRGPQFESKMQIRTEKSRPEVILRKENDECSIQSRGKVQSLTHYSNRISRQTHSSVPVSNLEEHRTQIKQQLISPPKRDPVSNQPHQRQLPQISASSKAKR